jgi:hypothetical protein
MRHSESIESVRSYYDALGEKEWDRLPATVAGESASRSTDVFFADSCGLAGESSR